MRYGSEQCEIVNTHRHARPPWSELIETSDTVHTTHARVAVRLHAKCERRIKMLQMGLIATDIHISACPSGSLAAT